MRASSSATSGTSPVVCYSNDRGRRRRRPRRIPTASSPGWTTVATGVANTGPVPPFTVTARASGRGKHRLQSGGNRPGHGRQESVGRPRRDEANRHPTQQQLSSWERAMHQRRDAVIARIGRVVARRADDAEEGVAMLLALMVILMLLTISITVAGVTLSQVKAEPARAQDDRDRKCRRSGIRYRAEPDPGRQHGCPDD